MSPLFTGKWTINIPLCWNLPYNYSDQSYIVIDHFYVMRKIRLCRILWFTYTWLFLNKFLRWYNLLFRWWTVMSALRIRNQYRGINWIGIWSSAISYLSSDLVPTYYYIFMYFNNCLQQKYFTITTRIINTSF